MEDMARLAVIEQSLRDTDKFYKILYELLRHISDILENPHDYEPRTIKSDILKGFYRCKAFYSYLMYLGFDHVGPDVFYPQEQTLNNLRMAQAAIERKISFCYGTLRKQNIVKISHSANIRTLKPAKILTTNNQLLLKIERLFNDVLVYEDEELLELAREEIPVINLQVMALDRVREGQKFIKAGKKDSLDLPFDKALLMELLGWFKHKFFTWVDQPACDGCGGPTTFSKNLTVKTERETCKMETYTCSACGVGSKFVRHNDPRKLLETRRGRCGEWANCFALLCRALGYDTRFVYDTTDHVWCEIFDYESNSWIHADPCEAQFNAPLMYCHGWGKKLSYVIAVSRDDLQDVTWRYTMNHKQVLTRRKECSEEELIECIQTLREHRQKQVSEPRRRYLTRRTLQELASFLFERKPSDYETHGRISGSEQWRAERGEMGSQISKTFEFKQLGQYTVSYYITTDEYRVQHQNEDLETIATWSAGVYHAENIFRKVEHDWKQVYLARNAVIRPPLDMTSPNLEGFAIIATLGRRIGDRSMVVKCIENAQGASVGSVSWRVCAGEGLQLAGLELCVRSQLYHDGTLAWSLQYDDLPPEAADFDAEALQRGVSITRACRSVVVRAALGGGRGTAAWQHAQLCRTPLALAQPGLTLTAHVTPI